MSGNLAEEIPLLKLCIINSEKISRFALIIFTGISFCWMALDASSKSISLSIPYTSTAEKLLCPWWFSFIFIVIGWFWNFLIISFTDSLLTGSSYINLLLISKFFTIVSKYDLKVSVISLSSETTFFPSIRFIRSLSPNVLEKQGLTDFQNYLLSVIFLILMLLE